MTDQKFDFVQETCEKIFRKKYMINGELTPEEVFREIADEISKNEDVVVGEQFYDVMIKKRFLPGGRTLANARLNTKFRSYNNCYYIPMGDSIEEIFQAVKEDAIIGKNGGGVGINVSCISPRGTVTNKGGEASGPVSFLKVFNTAASIIKTKGDRYAAHIGILDVGHPDIEEFITCKQGDNKKNLENFNISVSVSDEFMNAVKQDKQWDLKFDGKVCKTIAAKDLWLKMAKNQFVHNEPGILFKSTVDKFNNGYYDERLTLHGTNPCLHGDTEMITENELILMKDHDGKEAKIWNGSDFVKVKIFCSGIKPVYKIVTDRGLFLTGTEDHIIFSFDKEIKLCDSLGKAIDTMFGQAADTVISYEYVGEEKVYDFTEPVNHYGIANGIKVHNCGEIVMPNYGICNLGSLVLPMFIKNAFAKNSTFDWNEFGVAVRTAIRFLDDVIDVSDYPLDKIKEMAINARRVGLGITGLADTMVMLGMKYGSEESVKFTSRIGTELRDRSYEASATLAKEKGSFPWCDNDKLSKSKFIKTLPRGIQEEIKKYGLRNIALNTCAPSGSLSLVAGNVSSGVEAIFSLETDRRIKNADGELVGGFIFYDYALLKFREIYGDEKELPDCFVTVSDVDPKDQIEVQAELQKYIDNSISRTINLPKKYKFEEFVDLMMLAYESGLKGITTFNPDGSMRGILETKENKKEEVNKQSFVERREAPDRPNDLECDIHYTTVMNKGVRERHIVLVSLLNGTVYEVFNTIIATGTEEIDYKKGIVRKIKPNRYDLVVKNGSESTVIEDIGNVFDRYSCTLSRFISMSLRHGVPIDFVVEQLNKDKARQGIHGFDVALARILKKYIGENTKVLGQVCPECSGSLVYRDGCKSCENPECGWSKCG